MASALEKFKCELNEHLGCEPIDREYLISRLRMISKSFYIKISTKSKAQPRMCDGDGAPCKYYLGPIDINYLIKPNQCSLHRYCEYCFNSAVYQWLQRNPTQRLMCKKCEMLGNSTEIEESQLYEIIPNFHDLKSHYESMYHDNMLRRECASEFGCVFRDGNYIQDMVGFDCDEFLCKGCFSFLAASKIREKLNEIIENKNDRFLVPNLKFCCAKNHTASFNNNYTVDFAVSVIRETGGNDEFLKKIETYLQEFKPFFDGEQTPFIKCANCEKVQIYVQDEIKQCLNSECLKCVYQRHNFHPNLTCDQLLNDTWTIDTNAVQQPAANDESVKAKKFKTTTVVVDNLVIGGLRIRLSKIYEISNEYAESKFSNLLNSLNGKIIACITPFTTKQEADNQATNFLKIDQTTNCYVFLKKISAAPQQKFFILCDLLIKGDVILKKPTQIDLQQPANNIYADEEMYYVPQINSIMMRALGEII